MTLAASPLLLVVDPGLEPVAAEEAAERWPGASVRDDASGPGLVVVTLPAAAAGEAGPTAWGDPATLPLRTVLHVGRLAGEAEWATLQDVRDAVARTDVPELAGAASFRVTAHARGELPFTREQAAGAAGAVLQRRHGTRVDLRGYAVDVRLDLGSTRLALSVQWTREPLSKRVRRGQALRTSLKATTAAALVRLAGAHRGAGALVDPLCGAGTILVEAAGANDQLELFASDWDHDTVDVARATFANHGMAAVQTRSADARSLRAAWGRSFDHVVTDPPYGARLGRRTSLQTLYRDLLRAFAEGVSERGRVALVTPRRRALEGALRDGPWTVLDERWVQAGDLRPALVVLGRR